MKSKFDGAPAGTEPSILAGEQPLDALRKAGGYPQQDLGADLVPALLVARELSLGHPKLPGKVFLRGVEPAKLAQPPADRLPVNRFGRWFSFHGSLDFYYITYIILLYKYLHSHQRTQPTNQPTPRQNSRRR